MAFSECLNFKNNSTNTFLLGFTAVFAICPFIYYYLTYVLPYLWLTGKSFFLLRIPCPYISSIFRHNPSAMRWNDFWKSILVYTLSETQYDWRKIEQVTMKMLPVLEHSKRAKNSLIFQKCAKSTLTLMSNYEISFWL